MKLTLSLDEKVIAQAKVYAKKNQTSVSKMVENFLLSVIVKGKAQEISPLVKSLSGITQLPVGFDHKKERAAYLAKKHKIG